jgi:valyl-tRNA synthetase
VPSPFNAPLLEAFDDVKEAITGIRKIRTENNISSKEPLEITVKKGDKGYHERFNCILIKLCFLDKIQQVESENRDTFSFRVKSTTFYIFSESVTTTTTNDELAELEEDLNYYRGFLSSVMNKLKNERFINSAPSVVVEKEKAKKIDAEAKIKVLQERIFALKR